METTYEPPPNIPLSVEEWLDLVKKEPAISMAVRKGQKPMHVAQTTYKSGSKIHQSEFLHLRAIWSIYPGLDALDHLYPDKDDGACLPYRGYVSPENVDKAAAIYAKFSPFWQRYCTKLENGDLPKLTTDIHCGGWDTVRFLQDMTLIHVKEPATALAKVFKPGHTPPEDDGEGSSTAENPVPSFENLAISDPARIAAAAPPTHGTPRAEIYQMAAGSPPNRPSVDEMYPNTALLFFLEEIRKEMAGEMPLFNWIMPRLGLHLRALSDLCG